MSGPVGEPAYIALDDAGYVTLYWGDGSEAEKYVLARGARPASGAALVAAIEQLKQWAEGQGYVVVVPAYDLEAPEITIDLTENDAAVLDYDEIDDLLDDLYDAGAYED